MLKVRGGKKLPEKGIERVLIRGTNWIGDVVMTLPAVAAVRKTWPRARISVLAKPWVAEVYRLSADVDDVIVFQEPGRHAGIGGKLRLAGNSGASVSIARSSFRTRSRRRSSPDWPASRSAPVTTPMAEGFC